MSVLIETTQGDIVIDLLVETRPRSSLSFLKLCKLKYYNFCPFHYIESNFTAQTGDPTGEGRGGHSIFRLLYGDQAALFDAEMNPKIQHQQRGTVSMINNGSDMHGSQFFITLGENLDYLDDQNHTVFGYVAEGFDTLDKLNDAICDETHRPYRDVLITHTIVLEDPFDDPKGLPAAPSRSPSPPDELYEHRRGGRIGAFEDVDLEAGLTAQEIVEQTESKEATARTHILEMVGDLHHADEAPPDNVLFVCKLNPVTTDDDLNIIFSRFGPVKQAEVIRDRKSGDSLQYAFIEFEDPKHCENAYFKMDNVLIDDRRIHVDFSQSVSKNYQWENQPKSNPIRAPAKLKAIKNEPSTRSPSSKRRRSRSSSREKRKDRRRDDDDRRNNGRRNSPERSRDRDDRRNNGRRKSPEGRRRSSRDRQERRPSRDRHERRRSRDRDQKRRRSRSRDSGGRRRR